MYIYGVYCILLIRLLAYITLYVCTTNSTLATYIYPNIYTSIHTYIPTCKLTYTHIYIIHVPIYTIATGSQDKSIKLWQSDTLTCIATLNGHKRSIWKLVFSPIDKVCTHCTVLYCTVLYCSKVDVYNHINYFILLCILHVINIFLIFTLPLNFPLNFLLFRC